MTKRNTNSRFISRIFAVVIAMSLLLSMAITSNAAQATDAVNAVKSGVVNIQLWFVDHETAIEENIGYGTGFLINEKTVVTCHHVVAGFDNEWYVEYALIASELTGVKQTAQQVKEKIEIRVALKRDVYINASIKTVSDEMDYAVLTLDTAINGYTPLTLRHSTEVQQTEDVFAVGFPADIAELVENRQWDASDLVITSGTVDTVKEMSFLADDNTEDGRTYDNVNCIEHSAKIAGGNSGGPLVDSNGYVIGINAAGNSSRNIAVSISQVIDILDILGIEYKLAGKLDIEPTPTDPIVDDGVDTDKLSSLISEAKEKEEADYTEESYEELEDAIKEAEAAMKSDDQNEIDDAASKLEQVIDDLVDKKDSSSSNMGLIIIIAIVAVVIIAVVIILIVVMSKKNKKAVPASAPSASQHYAAPAPQPGPARVAPVAPPVAPVARPAQPTGETSVLNQGAGETSVLSHVAGETTVLSQAVNGGFLVRLSNNERIPISRSEFTIGRERNKVDYCVGGNTSISRLHATISVRNGKTYIVDNQAANGTFVNGVKARAGQEIELNSGDKIVLADEKFEFTK